MSATRTRWGFHQLADSWAQRIVGAAPIGPGDLVLDIGAGNGALTAPLVAARVRVLAVELHPGRARRLAEQFQNAPVRVVRADAADLRLPRQPFCVVANPPFGITAALLRRLVSPGSRLVTADLVVPLHVATRWAQLRAPGAQRWAQIFEPSVVCRIPPAAFRPPAPDVAAVLRIERRSVSLRR